MLFQPRANPDAPIADVFELALTAWARPAYILRPAETPGPVWLRRLQRVLGLGPRITKVEIMRL